MFNPLMRYYNNLKISSKIWATLSLLVILGIIQSSIVLYTNHLQNESETELAQLQAEIDMARDLQNHVLIGRNHETNVGLTFLRGGLPAIEEPVALALEESEESATVLAELEHSETSASKDQAALLQNIRTDLDDYQATVDEMINVQIVERGDMETGLVGDVMNPLMTVHSELDATDTIGLVTAYGETAETDVLMQIPTSMGALKTNIDNSDLSEDDKVRLKDEVQTAQTAFLALANHDLNIFGNVTLITTLSDQIIADLDIYVSTKIEEQVNLQADVDTTQARFLNIQYASLGIIVLLAFGLALLLTRSINMPLRYLTETSHRIAEGNYEQKVPIERRDELGFLASNFNRMVEAIAERDKSLQKQAEELQTAKDQAEDATRLKSEFLATMSHELRTPLNAIEGFSSIMLAGMGVELDPMSRDMVERISANSQRLVDLVNDVLDISRIEAGRVQIKYEPVAVQDMVNRWENEIKVVAEQKSLNFSSEVNSQVPPTLLTDWDAINKIVLNLLTNAVKYTEEGSVHLDLTTDENDWIIQVRDTGIGISPEAQTYIFEEFRQVDGSSKRKHGGVGLGLAIVQKLIRLMDGFINVESKLNEGSVFTVRLPLKTDELIVSGANNE